MTMTDRELMQQALRWADQHGEAVFAGGGMDAVDSMNEWTQALRSRLAQPEHHELQAKGEHPAPCARHCEATAFQIVIRNLKAQLAQPEQEPIKESSITHGHLWIGDLYGKGDA